MPSLTATERNALVMKHYPMLIKVAYKMVNRYPSSVDVDDLVSVGAIGLLDAAERFDPNRSVSFSAYARIRVQGAIVDELRKTDWVPRSVRNRHRKVRQARAQLAEDLGRTPSDAELAAYLDVTEERLAFLLQDEALLSFVSTEEKKGDSDQSIGASLSSDAQSPEEVAGDDEEAAYLQACIRQLPERDQKIIQMYYYEDLSFRQIGDLLGVTESRVSQLHTRLKKRLRGLIDEPEPAVAAY